MYVAYLLEAYTCACMHRYGICELVSGFEIAAILVYIFVAICFLTAGCVLRNGHRSDSHVSRNVYCTDMYTDMPVDMCEDLCI